MLKESFFLKAAGLLIIAASIIGSQSAFSQCEETESKLKSTTDKLIEGIEYYSRKTN